MKRVCLVAVVLFSAVSLLAQGQAPPQGGFTPAQLDAQGQGDRRAGHPLHIRGRLPEASHRPLPRRGHRRGAQLEGTRLRLHAQRRIVAPLPVRSDRRLRPGDRPRLVRVRDGARRARRSAGQHLDGRRRHQHRRQVQPRRQGRDGAGAPSRDGRRTDPDGDAGARRRRRTASIARPTSPGTRRATSSSPTATTTRAWRSTTRTADSSKSVGIRGTEPLQFNTPHCIQVDARGNVFVADRNNGRIQVLDNNLVLRAIYDNVGRAVGGVHHARARISISTARTPTPTTATTSSPRSPVRSTRWSSTARSSASSAWRARSSGKFQTVHAIDCKNENELLVAEIIAWRVQKITLQPKPTTTSSR